MSIHEEFDLDNRGEMIKNGLIKRFFLALVVILVALLSFGLGRLSSQDKRTGVEIKYDPSLFFTSSSTVSTLDTTNQTASTINATHLGQVFASSKGKRYYYPGCKNTISETNKVYFESAKMAEQAGYTLATNCQPK